MYLHTKEPNRSESYGYDNSMCMHVWLSNRLDGQDLFLIAPDGSLQNLPVF